MKKVIYVTCFLLTFTALQNAQCQKAFSAFSGDLTVNPSKTATNSYNGALQIQSSYVPDFALVGGLGYQFNTVDSKDFVSNSATTTKSLEVRYFPFGQRFISFKKPNYIREVCNGKFHCLRSFGLVKGPIIEQILRGFYFAPGFESAHTTLVLEPKKHLDAPQSQYNFDIKNKALTLAAGFQMRLARVTLGAGYRVSVGNPKATGDFDVFKDQLITNLRPVKVRIEHGFRIELGLNF